MIDGWEGGGESIALMDYCLDSLFWATAMVLKEIV